MVAQKMQASIFIPGMFSVRMIVCSIWYPNPGAPSLLEGNCLYIQEKMEA